MGRAIPIERVTLIDSLVAALELEIVSGDRPEGARLPGEEDLGKEYGVSRTVVREALSRLRERGLLETVNGRGTFVRHPAPEDLSASLLLQLQIQQTREEFTVEHLYEARIAIESMTARQAATRAGAEDIARLEQTLVEMEKYRGEKASYTQADVGFHIALAKASANPFLLAILQPLAKIIIDGVYLTSDDDLAVDNGIKGHGEILRCLKNRDPEAAAEAMRLHLIDSRHVFPDAAIAG